MQSEIKQNKRFRWAEDASPIKKTNPPNYARDPPSASRRALCPVAYFVNTNPIHICGAILVIHSEFIRRRWDKAAAMKFRQMRYFGGGKGENQLTMQPHTHTHIHTHTYTHTHTAHQRYISCVPPTPAAIIHHAVTQKGGGAARAGPTWGNHGRYTRWLRSTGLALFFFSSIRAAPGRKQRGLWTAIRLTGGSSLLLFFLFTSEAKIRLFCFNPA